MMAETTRWEYRLETFGTFWSRPKDEELQTILDEWGAEGWEVISAYPASNGEKVSLIAKRPLTSAARRQQSWPSD
jgi:hypothetical protein